MSDPASASSHHIRRTIYFSGHVQGVGFRFTTVEIAQRFPVTGWVRNLSDGRVELLAEGAARELDRFQQAIEMEMRAYISSVSAEDSPRSGKFQGFQIAK